MTLRRKYISLCSPTSFPSSKHNTTKGGVHIHLADNLNSFQHSLGVFGDQSSQHHSSLRSPHSTGLIVSETQQYLYWDSHSRNSQMRMRVPQIQASSRIWKFTHARHNKKGRKKRGRKRPNKKRKNMAEGREKIIVNYSVAFSTFVKLNLCMYDCRRSTGGRCKLIVAKVSWSEDSCMWFRSVEAWQRSLGES